MDIRKLILLLSDGQAFRKTYTRVLFFSLIILLGATFTSALQIPQAHATSVNKPTPKTAVSPNESVVAVHGLNAGDGSAGTASYGSATMPHCETYWEETRDFLRSTWSGDFRQVSYYNQEVKSDGYSPCADNGNERTYSADLQVTLYGNHCLSVGGGNTNAGTNNENLDHVSCLLAWYLYYNFGQHGWAEVLVGHSMGGVIIRRTMQLVHGHAGGFPASIGNVTDAITFNAPNIGATFANLGCNYCYQGHQLTSSSAWMTDLIKNGQAPSVQGWTTDWTVIASDCDTLLGETPLQTAANHKILYVLDGADGTCYDHGGAIHDLSTALNADTIYCDTAQAITDASDPVCGFVSGHGWSSTGGGSPRGLLELLYAIEYNNW